MSLDHAQLMKAWFFKFEILWLEPLWSTYMNMHYYVGMYLFERRVQAHSEFRNMSAVYCNDESCKCQRIKEELLDFMYFPNLGLF